MALPESDAGSEPIDAGPNLEFDPDFDGLDRAAQGKPDQQFGDLVIPAEDPDWKDVAARAEALLQRTRDLRILTHLAIARLHLGGLPGFAAVLAEIRHLVANGWEQVHPQLDPDDDNDPTLRANALLGLAEPRRVLRHLRNLPLAASPRAGRISWRDIGVAIGSIEPEADAERPTEAVVLAAFRETDQGKLGELREAIQAAARDVGGIGKAFDEHAGYGTGPALDELAKLLGDPPPCRSLRTGRGGRARCRPEDEPAEPEAMAAAGPAGPVRGAGSPTALSLTVLNSRAEALHVLNLVCDYYARQEPSSPLPLLIDRARRLADKSFLEILRDLAPDGLGQAQTIAGDRDG